MLVRAELGFGAGGLARGHGLHHQPPHPPSELWTLRGQTRAAGQPTTHVCLPEGWPVPRLPPCPLPGQQQQRLHEQARGERRETRGTARGSGARVTPHCAPCLPRLPPSPPLPLCLQIPLLPRPALGAQQASEARAIFQEGTVILPFLPTSSAVTVGSSLLEGRAGCRRRPLNY